MGGGRSEGRRASEDGQHICNRVIGSKEGGIEKKIVCCRLRAFVLKRTNTATDNFTERPGGASEAEGMT